MAARGLRKDVKRHMTLLQVQSVDRFARQNIIRFSSASTYNISGRADTADFPGRSLIFDSIYQHIGIFSNPKSKRVCISVTHKVTLDSVDRAADTTFPRNTLGETCRIYT